MLGLYIHIPFCVSKCKYCDFNSFKLDGKLKKRYISDLKKEIKIYSQNYKNQEITSVFFGGGTPSILNENELREIFKNIYDNFNISKDAEITMECNPGTLTIEKLKVIKDLDVNRLSIGLQSTHNKHLNYIGRIHTYEEFEKNFKDARKVGFDNINIDLMYSIPNQNFNDWRETLSKIVKLNPEHISAYSLILEEETELFKMFERDEFNLLDEDEDIRLYNYTIEYLGENGYNQYEISNYSKNGYECIHNILYWKCGSYIGIGPGASGYIKGARYLNVKSLDDYNDLLNEGRYPIENKDILSRKDKIEEKIFMGLRMNKGIKFEDFKIEFNLDFMNKYREIIEKLNRVELIQVDEIGIKLTQKGREISNSVFVEFID